MNQSLTISLFVGACLGCTPDERLDTTTKSASIACSEGSSATCMPIKDFKFTLPFSANTCVAVEFSKPDERLELKKVRYDIQFIDPADPEPILSTAWTTFSEESPREPEIGKSYGESQDILTSFLKQGDDAYVTNQTKVTYLTLPKVDGDRFKAQIDLTFTRIGQGIGDSSQETISGVVDVLARDAMCTP